MPDLFTPLAIGDLVLPNRIIMAPLTRSRATLERVPTPIMIQHYVQRASAGLIIAEATNIAPQSLAWDCAPGIYAREQIEVWANWCARCTMRVDASRCSSGTEAASPAIARRRRNPHSRRQELTTIWTRLPSGDLVRRAGSSSSRRRPRAL